MLLLRDVLRLNEITQAIETHGDILNFSMGARARRIVSNTSRRRASGNFSNRNVYAPNTTINVSGQGGNGIAGQIVREVGKPLEGAAPDTFRKSDARKMTEAQLAMQRAARRNG